MLTVRRSTTNGLEEVSRDSIPDLLRRSDAKLWFHFDAPTDEELRFLEEELKIHHLTLEDIVSLEDRLLRRASNEDINRLLALKRSLVHIRRAVSPQREVFNQLTRHDFPFIQPGNLVYFRDVYDHLIRITEELDSIRDILSGALEIHLASASNQLNVTM